MSNLMQGTPWNEGDVVFVTNEHVRTVEGAKPSTDWTSGALKSRRWNITGRIYAKHDSHGVVYDVRHDDDGSIGCYEPRELRPCGEPARGMPPRAEAPPATAKAEWEVINSSTSRLKVPNGWLYRTRTYKNLTNYVNFPQKDEYVVTGESTTFVPDPLPTTIVP